MPGIYKQDQTVYTIYLGIIYDMKSDKKCEQTIKVIIYVKCCFRFKCPCVRF